MLQSMIYTVYTVPVFLSYSIVITNVLPEGYHTVAALEGPRIIRRRRAKRGVDVDLVEMADRALVLLQVALGAEADGAGVAAERPFKVVDVDVEAQLGRLGEDLLTDDAHGLSLLVSLKDLLQRTKKVSEFLTIKILNELNNMG